MSSEAILERLHLAYEANIRETSPELAQDFAAFLSLLQSGELRSATCENGEWRVHRRVKEGILVGFRIGRISLMSGEKSHLFFSDKDTFPIQRPALLRENIRIVPGGSSIRVGAYVGKNVTCMPPMYINVGAYVDDGTLVDSHALVGSCAQIGKNVHLSAAVQIGGVLEPIGMRPVIVEDDVLVGGNCGIFEGTLVRARAIIGSGTILTASTPVYDVVRNEIYRATAEKPLEIPEGAVVVPGSRPLKREFALKHSLQIYTPIIVKYRDKKTDLRAALEGDLR